MSMGWSGAVSLLAPSRSRLTDPFISVSPIIVISRFEHCILFPIFNLVYIGCWQEQDVWRAAILHCARVYVARSTYYVFELLVRGK